MALVSPISPEMPLTSQETTDAAPFTELFLSNAFLLSLLFSFVPWKDFLALSQTSKAWRGFFTRPRTSISRAESQKSAELRNVILTRYVEGFGKVLREVGPENIKHRLNFRIDICWEDLVLLLISQQTPLHTYPTHALSVLSSSSVPESSRKPRSPRMSLKTARLASLTLAHSRFVLLLQSIAHSSFNPPPQEEDSPVFHTHSEPLSGHHRTSSAGSIRELVFPAPLAAHPPMTQASQSMTDISTLPANSNGVKQAVAPTRVLSRTKGGSRADSSSLKSSRPPLPFPSSASTPSIAFTPSPTMKPQRRLSVASMLKKSSASLPPPVSESRALREYSSNFGWRRGLNDAKGKWEAASNSYRSHSSLRRQSTEDTVGYGSEIEVDDDELFSTPRRRFVGSDAGVRSSESSFSEGTISSSTSASNSTSATSISGSDSPPLLPQKDSLSGAEVLAMNRGRVRPANIDVLKMRSASASRSRQPSSAPSDFPPPNSGTMNASKSFRASTVSPRGTGIKRASVSWADGPSVPDSEDYSNPHALRLAASRIRAPVLRVFVPSSDMSIPPADDFMPSSVVSGVPRCEEELIRAGLWDHLSVGDVVCNFGYVPPSLSPFQGSSGAVWLIYNGCQLVPFAPGAQDGKDVLPVYKIPEGIKTGGEGQEAWSLPSWGYFEHLLQQELGVRSGSGSPGVGRKHETTTGMNMRILMSTIPVSPVHPDMMPEPQLIAVPTRIPSPHTPGGLVMVKKWVWTLRVWVPGPNSSVVPSFPAVGREIEVEVGAGWEGEWVLEGDGTKEGRESLLSCLRRDQKGKDLMEWQLVRDRCGRGRVWLRLLNSSVSVNPL
ncbi:hypothetical protein GYMLUDRAFT_71833 [Collybiopsis luxurians FD-317 M1]|uniref:F-box domain-containing protein n=1 Tax=Collybiopsis luxurians FD-317 M1 TaxID=944289 RepID=A0A0D0D370_9AGAR|nr:hypothetical protein GYMLUDRAFT_71833 [Collybiopsis luxurians FD-317 M1]